MEKMKAVILSRGRGVHLLHGRGLTSKALIPVNGLPFLYYVLKHFYFYGLSDITICVDSNCEEDIRKLVSEYSDNDHFKYLLTKIKFRVINTGTNNKTGSMLVSIKHLLEDGAFIVTTNDIITDVNLSQLIEYHRAKAKILTVLGVHPTVRQGIIKHEDGIVTKYSFEELLGTIIKGGYFVSSRKIFEYLTDDCFLEREPLQRLISDGQAAVFDHKGFWKQIDSWRDLEEIEKLFEEDDASWRIK
ncbi:MAG: sugar phosphate nucleotidyltransferase [Planctomycetota bacterium]